MDDLLSLVAIDPLSMAMPGRTPLSAPLDAGITATDIRNGLNQTAIRVTALENAPPPAAAGFTPTTLTITTEEIAASASASVTVTPDFTSGVLLGARLTKIAGTSASARVNLSQQPGMLPGEIDVISSSMDFGDNLAAGPAYGPSARSGGSVRSEVFFIRPVAGDLVFTFYNRGNEGESITLELEVLVLPLSFS